jgi:hypothetical protein
MGAVVLDGAEIADDLRRLRTDNEVLEAFVKGAAAPL